MVLEPKYEIIYAGLEGLVYGKDKNSYEIEYTEETGDFLISIEDTRIIRGRETYENNNYATYYSFWQLRIHDIGRDNFLFRSDIKTERTEHDF